MPRDLLELCATNPAHEYFHEHLANGQFAQSDIRNGKRSIYLLQDGSFHCVQFYINFRRFSTRQPSAGSLPQMSRAPSIQDAFLLFRIGAPHDMLRRAVWSNTVLRQIASRRAIASNTSWSVVVVPVPRLIVTLSPFFSARMFARTISPTNT